MFKTSLFRDRFAEFIIRFEVERQGLFSMLDGLFVGFPRVLAFERRKIGQIAVGVAFDRETICSRIYLHIFIIIVRAYVLCANIDTLKSCVVIEWLC